MASLACACVIAPVSAIARRTSLRRAIAPSGLVYGLSPEVCCTSPASSADWGMFRSLALTSKYVRAAFSMPKAPLPNGTMLRYPVSTSSLVISSSRSWAMRISRSLRP